MNFVHCRSKVWGPYNFLMFVKIFTSALHLFDQKYNNIFKILL